MKIIGVIFTVLMISFSFAYSEFNQSTFFEEKIFDDKAKEKPYEDASEIARKKPVPEGQGCQTIPFSSVQRTCKTISAEKTRICHPTGGLQKCGRLNAELNAALKSKDKEQIKAVREKLVSRKEGFESCIEIRNKMQETFKDAKQMVERDKDSFESSLRKAKDSKTQDFYKKMIQYCDDILNYFNDSESGHDEAITVLRPPITDCEGFIKRADRGL